VDKYMRRAEEIKLYVKLSKDKMKMAPSGSDEEQSRTYLSTRFFCALWEYFFVL